MELLTLKKSYRAVLEWEIVMLRCLLGVTLRCVRWKSEVNIWFFLREKVSKKEFGA